MMRRLHTWAVCCLLACCMLPAWAHKASDAYLQVNDAPPRAVSLKLSLALRDLDAAIESLDGDNNRQLNWGEVRQAIPAIQTWVAAGVSLQCGGARAALEWTFESLEQRSDGVYLRLAAQAPCADQAMELDYQLLKTVDATHRLLVAGTLQGQPLAAVLSPQSSKAVVLRQAQALGRSSAGHTGPAVLAQFFPEGVHHIATGYDHLAFLLALLLPIMLKTARSSAPAAAPGRPGLWALLRTVTGFTVGHSITLVLASLGWIASPSWVEPAIAITIGISALLNLYPVRWLRSDVLALGFGLIHGLGFSSIMREAQVSDALLPWALAGFNLGVEAGQLVGVALWCAAHLVLVRWQRYEQVVVRGGSWALLALAVFWAAQRLSAP